MRWARSCFDLTLEIVCRRKRPVHRGESQVGDFIEFAQRTEDRKPDLVAGDFRRTTGSYGVLDLLGQQVQRIVVDLSALTRPAHTADHLLAAERFGHTAALDHGQHRGFHGGESPPALRARPAASDGLSLVGLAGVDDS